MRDASDAGDKKEEKAQPRCACAGGVEGEEGGLATFCKLRGEKEALPSCLVRWAQEISSILIFIAATTYLIMATIQLPREPGSTKPIWENPTTCLITEGNLATFTPDQNEICIELPQRVIDWNGWPESSIELADFSTAWNVDDNTTTTTLGPGGRTIILVDPKQLRNDTFLAINFNSDLCNRKVEYDAALRHGLALSTSTMVVDWKKALGDGGSMECVNCDQSCVTAGSLAQAGPRDEQCNGYMPETKGTIDYGCTGVPISPPFEMAVRLDERSWEETLQGTDPLHILRVTPESLAPSAIIKYKMSGGWSWSTFIIHFIVSTTSIVTAIVTIVMSTVMRCNGQRVGKMPTCFPVTLLAITAFSSVLLGWSIFTDYKDLEAWTDFSEKGTDQLWLPIRNLTDDLLWGQSELEPFTPDRYVRQYLNMMDSAKADKVYEQLREEVLFLYTARSVLLAKQIQDASKDITYNTDQKDSLMKEWVTRAKWEGVAKSDENFCKPWNNRVFEEGDSGRRRTNVSFPAWAGENSLGAFRKDKGGYRYPFLQPNVVGSTSSDVNLSEIVKDYQRVGLESCFPNWVNGSSNTNYKWFWKQDDLKYQYFRINFDPTQYWVLWSIEIGLLGLYIVSTIRLIFIVTLMGKVRFLVRARNGACSNCKIVYTLDEWPYQCAMCGGHFCSTCAKQKRLLVGETNLSVFNLALNKIRLGRAANTAATAHHARVCNTCYGVFPPVTRGGEADIADMAKKLWADVAEAWSFTYRQKFEGEGTYGMRCAKQSEKDRVVAERMLKKRLRRKYGLYWRAGLKAFAKSANEYLIAYAQVNSLELDENSTDSQKRALVAKTVLLFPVLPEAAEKQSAANIKAMKGWEAGVEAMFLRVSFGLPGPDTKLKKKKKATDDMMTWQQKQKALLKQLDEAQSDAVEDGILDDESLYTDNVDEYTPLRPSARTASLLTEFSRLTLAEQSEFFASLGGLTGDAATREDMKRQSARPTSDALNGAAGGDDTELLDADGLAMSSADKVSHQPLAAFHGRDKIKMALYGKDITAGLWADMALFPGYTVFFKPWDATKGGSRPRYSKFSSTVEFEDIANTMSVKDLRAAQEAVRKERERNDSDGTFDANAVANALDAREEEDTRSGCKKCWESFMDFRLPTLFAWIPTTSTNKTSSVNEREAAREREQIPDIDLAAQGIHMTHAKESDVHRPKMKTLFQFSRDITNTQSHFFRSIKGRVVEIILMQQISFVEVDDKTVTLSKSIDTKGVSKHTIEFATIEMAERAGDIWKGQVYHATHPFNATFSPHKKTRVRIFLCGAAYFAAAADAMMAARDTIMIADWFFSCEVYLKRAKGHPLAAEWRLDNLLQRKAREGVKVYILIWKDLMTNCGSQIAKKRMEALHDNIHVILHRAPMQKSVMMWTHHQKFVCVDQAIAFVGGIDLAYGRFDTPSHPLLDVPVNGCTLFPGMDYTNPQIDGGGRSEEGVLRPFHDLLDRKTQPRMPWQDIHCCINGEAARDVSLNFVQRWNEHRAVMQLRPLPIWPTIHTATWDFPHGWDDAQVQVLRSLSGWSGHSTEEASIYFAMLAAIEHAKHYIYIESQFFISSPRKSHSVAVNLIAQKLAERLEQAFAWEKEFDEDSNFRITFVLPFHADGALAESETVTKVILHHTQRAVARGDENTKVPEAQWDFKDRPEWRVNGSVIGILRRNAKDRIAAEEKKESGGNKMYLERDRKLLEVDFCRHIRFFGLYRYEKLGTTANGEVPLYVTSQIYVHTKLLLVDDSIMILGSANCNDRSMLGARDSEIAVRVEDTEFSQCKIGDRDFERAAGSTFRSSSTTTGMGHDGNPIATSTSAGGGAVPATASTTSARTKVGRNIQAFRMRLWNHHLGHPPHSTKTLDFASESTWDSITSTAKKNADALHDAFPGQFPHDSYQKWHTPKDSGDVEGGGAAAIGFVDAKLKWSEDMKKAKERGKKTMSTWENEMEDKLKSVQGFLCDWPTRFLGDENLGLQKGEALAGTMVGEHFFC